MTTINFDTLKFTNTLKAVAVAISKALEVNLKELVTKEDLHREIEMLRRDIDARFIQVEQPLIIKLGALMTLAIGIVAALVKLL